MWQRSLLDYTCKNNASASKTEHFTCPVCGRRFTSRRSMLIHLRNKGDQKHRSYIYNLLVHPSEGIEVACYGNIAELRIRMDRKLWDDIRARADEENIQLDTMIFDILANLAAFGLEYRLYSRWGRVEEIAKVIAEARKDERNPLVV